MSCASNLTKSGKLWGRKDKWEVVYFAVLYILMAATTISLTISGRKKPRTKPRWRKPRAQVVNKLSIQQVHIQPALDVHTDLVFQDQSHGNRFWD